MTTIQNNSFFDLWSAHEALTFSPFQFGSKADDHRLFDVEFFGNFSCSFKMINFDDGSQLVVVTFRWLVTTLLIFKALISFAKLLEPPLYCMFISSS